MSEGEQMIWAIGYIAIGVAVFGLLVLASGTEGFDWRKPETWLIAFGVVVLWPIVEMFVA